MPRPDQNDDRASPVILWFRNDLRLRDHAGVAAALATKRPILPVFIWDEQAGTRALGAASKWWLHRSLHVLDEELGKFESRLIVARGRSQVILASIAIKNHVKTIICSHTFDPVTEEFDRGLADELRHLGIKLERHNTTLLSEPGSLRTKDDKPFRVFTPFYKALQTSGRLHVDSPIPLSTRVWPRPPSWPQSLAIDDLGLDKTLTPSGQDWAKGFQGFTPGERGARGALRHFLGHILETYEHDRDRPDLDRTSRLSPHLRFGEISSQRILLELDKAVTASPALETSAAKFRAELAWREFSYSLLAQQPRLDCVNFRHDFDTFPWRDDDNEFRAWCRGETGYDLVDAGMQELWQTGYMHNRVRMVVASFLVKHLLVDWRRGEQWFWDCLVDADPANNPASWQWVAGCGADAAPYFRIFNPITQADKFDPDEAYRNRYNRGRQFKPIVEHGFARDRALAAYKSRGDDHHDHAD